MLQRVEYWIDEETPGPEDEPDGAFDTSFDDDSSWRDMIARQVCERLWAKHDGSDWMEGCKDVIVFRVDGGPIRRFTFSMEFEPSYYIAMERT